jgi:transglutaminase-like putative cysteine protease
MLVLAALGVIGFEPSFGGFGFVAAGIGGLVLGAATGILTSVVRLGAVTTALAAIVAYFLVGPAVAVPEQAVFGVLPSLQSFASVAVGTVYGWADIVTLSTPIGAPAYIAVVPYFATWFVALLSTTLATRWLSSRPRTAWRFGVALIAPVALYLASILIGTDEPYQAGIRGVVFAVLALIWLGWRRQGAPIAQGSAARLRNRKLAGTAIVVTGAVALGGVVGFVAAPPNDSRFVLREEIEPPFDPLDYPSPLAGFRHYTKQVTDDVMFTVEGLEAGDVIRLATLDSFTGKLWNVTGPESSAAGSGEFELVGRSLPRTDFITEVPRDDVTFTIVDYDDVWLPSVGYPLDIDFTAGDAASHTDDLRYNSLTGTTVLTSGVRSGDVYTMDAVVQRPYGPSDLNGTATASIELPPVEGSPDIVSVRAQELAGSSADPIDQLEAMRLALVDNGFLSHGRASDAVPSRAGHGADRITELFERNQMIGDQEQYASAFALMARSLGYPARVVMGFAPDIIEGQPVEVTGDDVTVWVEIAFDNIGWVAFNPTPDETDIPQDQVPQPQSEPQPQVRQPPRSEKDDEKLLSPVELEETEDDDNGLAFILPGWVIVLGLSLLIPAAIVFVPLLIIGAIKARRARRRRETGPGHDRVAGAWQELTDQYSELGYAVPSRLTRGLVAERLERQVPEAVRLRALAASTDEAVFSGREIDEQATGVVWTEALAAVEIARAGLSRGRRWLSRYRIRSARDWVARVASRGQQDGKP